MVFLILFFLIKLIQYPQNISYPTSGYLSVSSLTIAFAFSWLPSSFRVIAIASAILSMSSGGTDNHLMLVDLRSLGVTGKQMETLLDEVNITCNKNAIPNDPQSPFVTSGLRLGTPAATTRGFDAEDMDQIAEAIALTLKDFDGNKDKAMAIVKSLTDKHPLYE